MQKCELKFSRENFYYVFFLNMRNVQIWILQIYVNLSNQPFQPWSDFSRRALIVIFVPGTRSIVELRLHGSNVNT